jgi:hypothetical protein
VTKSGKKKGKTPYFSCYQGKLSKIPGQFRRGGQKSKEERKSKDGVRSNMDIGDWKPKMKNGFYETR